MGWDEASRHIAAADPSMAGVIARVGTCGLAPRRQAGGRFGALVRSVLYQQLAGRAAHTIHERFLALYDGTPTPELVLATPDEQLRAAGLSGAKAASIKDLAARVLDGSVRLRSIHRYDDEAVIAALVTVRGIGRWTSEMFLMFELQRPDVWPVGDLGVRKGWMLAHRAPVMLRPAELTEAGEAMRPWRSVAAWYCWQAVSSEGGQW